MKKRRNGEVVDLASRRPKPALSTDRLADYFEAHASTGFTAAKMAKDFNVPEANAERLLSMIESSGLLTSVQTAVRGTKVYRPPVARGPFVEHRQVDYAAEREKSRRVRAEADERAARTARYKVNDVVVIRGGRRRYVVTVVEPNYGGGTQTYYLVALSGGEAGSAPSGVREDQITRAKDQTLRWEGVMANRLKARYVSSSGLLVAPEKSRAAFEAAGKAAQAAPTSVDPGVVLARKVRSVFPSRLGHYRGASIKVPKRGKAVVHVLVPLKPLDTYAKRLWAAIENLNSRNLTVNNVEAGLGRIVVTDDGHAMPPQMLWKETARAAHMSGEKASEEERRNPTGAAKRRRGWR